MNFTLVLLASLDCYCLVSPHLPSCCAVEEGLDNRVGISNNICKLWGKVKKTSQKLCALCDYSFHKGNTSIIPEFRLTDILPSLEKLSSYYRYSGSLTKPGCDEAIIWTVFQESFSISQQQVEKTDDFPINMRELGFILHSFRQFN